MKISHLFIALIICLGICSMIKWAFLLAILCLALLVLKLSSWWHAQTKTNCKCDSKKNNS